MLIFSDKYYKELADEITEQVEALEGVVCGVVELCWGRFELIFGFDYECIIRRWILIVFENGVRSSSDFSIAKLEQWL